MNKNNECGYTLTELLIACLIVAILSLVAIPVYRGYVRRGIATEGKALLGEINAAQQSYYYRNGAYFFIETFTSFEPKIGVDARNNQYFTSYSISFNKEAKSFEAKTNAYKGGGLTLKGSFTAAPTIVDNFTNSVG